MASAFEFAEICRDMDYHNFLFSMKASNPVVMVQVCLSAEVAIPALHAACETCDCGCG